MALLLSTSAVAYSQAKQGPGGMRGRPPAERRAESNRADPFDETGPKEHDVDKTAEDALADVFAGDEKAKSNEKASAEEKKRKDEAIEAGKQLLGPVLSFYIVSAEERRYQAMGVIAKEKKYSRYGGVVSRLVLYKAQQQIRRADDEIIRLRAIAKVFKAKMLTRKHPLVKRVEQCLEGDGEFDLECQTMHRLAMLVDYQDPHEVE